jgi:hypothetical protein
MRIKVLRVMKSNKKKVKQGWLSRLREKLLNLVMKMTLVWIKRKMNMTMKMWM